MSIRFLHTPFIYAEDSFPFHLHLELGAQVRAGASPAQDIPDLIIARSRNCKNYWELAALVELLSSRK